MFIHCQKIITKQNKRKGLKFLFLFSFFAPLQANKQNNKRKEEKDNWANEDKCVVLQTLTSPVLV